MAIQSRILAVVGVLVLGGASAARAQQPTNAPKTDTSAAARSDTSGYRAYQNATDTAQAGQPTARTDSTGFKYTGPPTDTTLKAKPGAQTGPTAGDTAAAARTAGAAGAADTVVCKDGSNAAKLQGCARHGGIDSAATKAALKARGQTVNPAGDSSGARADTALKAKPGTQTGPDTSAAGKSDTSGTSQHQGP